MINWYNNTVEESSLLIILNWKNCLKLMKRSQVVYLLDKRCLLVTSTILEFHHHQKKLPNKYYLKLYSCVKFPENKTKKNQMEQALVDKLMDVNKVNWRFFEKKIFFLLSFFLFQINNTCKFKYSIVIEFSSARKANY